MLVYYVYSALKITVEFKDNSAMRLILLYYVRSIAWFNGAVITTVTYIVVGDRGK
jgi:hypothetical protein